LWVAAILDQLDVGKEAPPQLDDALVARAQVLVPAVAHRALADPGDEVLVHYVRADPAAGLLVLDRRPPIGDGILFERFRARNSVHEPADAERVEVVDRHAPLEVIARQKAIGPQSNLALRPLPRIGSDAAVDVAVIEFIETDAQVSRPVRSLL